MGLFAILFSDRLGVGAKGAFLIDPDITVSSTDEANTATVAFEVRNVTNREMEITAIKKNCSCAVVRKLPIKLPAQKTVAIPVKIDLSNLKPEDAIGFYFFLESPSLILKGTVIVSGEQSRP